MIKRLSEEEKKAVRTTFHQNMIFMLLRNPLRTLEEETSPLSLSPEEVFLVAMTHFDYVLDDEDGARVDFIRLRESFVSELSYFDIERRIEHNQALGMAADEIIFVVWLLLISTGIDELCEIARILPSQATGDNFLYLRKLFKPYVATINPGNLEDYLDTYVEKRKRLSGDILDCINRAPKTAAALPAVQTPQAAAAPPADRSHIRVAKWKKTKVLTVLNAMHKAGWFVDDKGKKLSNKDKALNEILKYAFGEDKPTRIDQLINPSQDPDHQEKHRKCINEMLDEDCVKQIIEEIKDELLKTVK